jgi:methionine synthase II (cobalamin-independent)
MTEKYRGDHIGSLPRPETLFAARRGHDAGEVSDADLRETEDQVITIAVRGQEASGIDVLTEGEFRRRDFRSGFAQAVDLLTEAEQYAKLALVNLPTAGWDVHRTFGGFRDSGSAFKKQSAPGIRFYTRIKTAAVRFAW